MGSFPWRPGLAPSSAALAGVSLGRGGHRAAFVCLQINHQRAAGARAGLSPTGRGARRPGRRRGVRTFPL